jgi:hypothetical protein
MASWWVQVPRSVCLLHDGWVHLGVALSEHASTRIRSQYVPSDERGMLAGDVGELGDNGFVVEG